MLFILIIYILRECLNDTDKAPTHTELIVRGLHRKRVGGRMSKRVLEGEEEERKHRVLFVHSLGKGQ